MAKVIYVAGPYRSDSAWGVELNVRKAEVVGLQIWHMGAVAMVPGLMKCGLLARWSD